ncbi:MAG TPA: YraN family protein [Methylophilaceae bacterium]
MKNDGAAAEQLVSEYLQRNGLQLIESNFLCRFGEIDLILHDGTTLVFVEVRLRTNPHFGGAVGSITSAKQGRIIRAAQIYLQQQSREMACRFDVVVLDGERNIEWIKNAFAT